MDAELRNFLARIARGTDDNGATLIRVERLLEGIAGRQKTDGDLLGMVAERQDEVVKLLTPQEKDGPSIDELLGHIIGQMTELIGYVREAVKGQKQMEQNLPEDVVRAITASATFMAAVVAAVAGKPIAAGGIGVAAAGGGTGRGGASGNGTAGANGSATSGRT